MVYLFWSLILPWRRDKYESNVKEFWIDVETSGSYEDEHEETLQITTGASGSAHDFELGLPAMDPGSTRHSPGEPIADDTDQDVSEDDGASSKSKPNAKGSMGPERESALEDGVPNAMFCVGWQFLFH